MAANEGDMAGLMELLAGDAIAYSDGGGRVPAATRPVFGADRVARFILGIARKDPPASVELADVNGSPGLLLRTQRGRIGTVILLEPGDDGLVSTIFAMRNPDKLRRAG